MASYLLADLGIVIGLDWTLHESVAIAKRALPRRDTPGFVRRAIGKECVQGLVVDLPHKKFGKKPPAAGALVVAAVAPDAIVYHRLENGMVWVCAVIHGVPTTGFDVIQDEDLARQTFNELMSYVPSAVIIGNEAQAVQSLEDALASVRVEARRRAHIVRPGQGFKRVLRVGGVVLLTVGAWKAYEHYASRPIAPPPWPDQTIPTTPAADPVADPREVEKESGQQAFEREVQARRATFLWAVSPRDQYLVWHKVLRGLPLSVSGWTPTALTCVPAQCTVTWQRAPMALPSSISLLPGDLAVGARHAGANSAITYFTPQRLEPIHYERSDLDVERLIVDTGVLLTNSMSLRLSPAKDVLVTPKKGVNNDKPVLIGRQGEWTVQGNNPLAIEAVLLRLTLAGVQLKEMSVRGGSVHDANNGFALKGNYHVLKEEP